MAGRMICHMPRLSFISLKLIEKRFSRPKGSIGFCGAARNALKKAREILLKGKAISRPVTPGIRQFGLPSPAFSIG